MTHVTRTYRRKRGIFIRVHAGWYFIRLARR